jgi:hypothetical protein
MGRPGSISYSECFGPPTTMRLSVEDRHQVDVAAVANRDEYVSVDR